MAAWTRPEPNGRIGDGAGSLLLPRGPSDHHPHLVECRGPSGVAGCDDVTDVRRVERSSENAELHRLIPSTMVRLARQIMPHGTSDSGGLPPTFQLNTSISSPMCRNKHHQPDVTHVTSSPGTTRTVYMLK